MENSTIAIIVLVIILLIVIAVYIVFFIGAFTAISRYPDEKIATYSIVAVVLLIVLFILSYFVVENSIMLYVCIGLGIAVYVIIVLLYIESMKYEGMSGYFLPLLIVLTIYIIAIIINVIMIATNESYREWFSKLIKKYD